MAGSLERLGFFVESHGPVSLLGKELVNLMAGMHDDLLSPLLFLLQGPVNLLIYRLQLLGGPLHHSVWLL